MPKISLDNISGVEVGDNHFFNERRTLQMMSTGLIRIANYMSQREVAWQQQNKGNVKYFVYGKDIDGTEGELDLFACFFIGLGFQSVTMPVLWVLYEACLRGILPVLI